MGSAATQAKQRWNSAHYKQVKISIDPEVATAFKAACASSEVSMASQLSQYMSEFSDIAPKTKLPPDYSTKRKRRSAVQAILQQLEQIKAAEEKSKNNIPENFRRSDAYKNSGRSISLLDKGLELLKSLY